MRVLVVGGGIGGLTAALSLHAAGIEAIVVESARQIRALGVGINLLPHAVRELTELGLGDSLAAGGIPTAELVYYDRYGNRIWGEPRGLAAGYRWPQYSIHRGLLQLLLLDAVVDRLGPDAVRTGLAVERFNESDTEISVEALDRVTGRRSTLAADVVVGADGIHSRVRSQLHPGEGPPLWNGIRMWRGVTATQPFLSGRTMVMAGSNAQAKFVAYPISWQTEKPGLAAVNWVAEVNVGHRDGAEARWDRVGRAEDVLAHFGDWRLEWLDVPALITAAPEIFEYPMVDRDPLPWWGRGRVSLLGDAAHPMYPIGSNGASQAIIDARVLAWELAQAVDPRNGLAAYEARRREATNELVRANRSLGPERVMRMVEQRAPQGFDRIEDVMSAEELESIALSYKRLAGFDAQTLNQSPSWDTSITASRPTPCRGAKSGAAPGRLSDAAHRAPDLARGSSE